MIATHLFLRIVSDFVENFIQYTKLREQAKLVQNNIEYDLSKSKLFPSFHQNIAWKGQDRLRRTKSFQLRKSRMLDRKLRLKQRNSP